MAEHNHAPDVVRLEGACPRCDADFYAPLPAPPTGARGLLAQPAAPCCGSPRLDSHGTPIVEEGGHAD